LVLPLNLPDAAIAVLGRIAGVVEKVNEPLVTKLVGDGVISSGQAHAVGLSVSLHDLLDGDLDALTGIHSLR
jgi:hypothetical protein